MNLLDDLLRLFFPETCRVCHQTLVKGEEVICLECGAKIPVTNHHLAPYANPLLEKLVDTNAPIERAAAYFFYKKDNPYAQLIQDAKYRNQPRIALVLARDYALSILPYGFFDGIDAIVPVPIHWTKHLRRGYNQTHYLASGLSEVTGIPILPLLKATRPHKTQTHKSGSERRQLSGDSLFAVDPSSVAKHFPPLHPGLQESRPYQHLLLVDDVITTGSTILSCARALHRALPGLRLSILSLATTTLN